MLTDGRQIAAARQLLDWSQADLADASGASKPSIIRIEKNLFSVKDDSRHKIIDAFAANNIEFIDGGARINSLKVLSYSGQDGMRAFYDDIYLTAQSEGGIFYIFNGAPSSIIKFLGEDWYKNHAQRMENIGDNYRFKVIVKEGEKGLIGKSFAEYRYFPEDQFSEKTIYCYGTKVAFANFQNDTVEIAIINEKEIADSMRILCQLAWQKAD